MASEFFFLPEGRLNFCNKVAIFRWRHTLIFLAFARSFSRIACSYILAIAFYEGIDSILASTVASPSQAASSQTSAPQKRPYEPSRLHRQTVD
jgi:hypothetical protein